MRLELGASLAASPERVWEVLADWERYPEWMPDVSWVRLLGPDRGEGMRLAVRTKVLGIPLVTDELHITAWEPPRRMRIEHLGLVGGSGQWRLEPIPSGTRFEWTEELAMPPPVLGSLALLLYSPVLRWTFRRSIRNLRRLVESKP